MDHIRHVTVTELDACVATDRDHILVADVSPPLDAAGLAELVARFGTQPVDPESVDVRVVEHVPEVTDSTALSLDALAPHTDGSFLPDPPAWFALSAVRSDRGGGGRSLFHPVDDVVAAAPRWVVDALAEGRFRFLKTYDGDTSDSVVAPVLTRRDDRAWLIRWRGDHIYRPEPVEPQDARGREAVEWLYAHLRDGTPVEHTLEDGQLALIPNGRFLHGRSALMPRSERQILRAWVS